MPLRNCDHKPARAPVFFFYGAFHAAFTVCASMYASQHGPWMLSFDHSGVAAQVGALPLSGTPGPRKTVG
jgi:hypothetical protein